MVPGLWVFVVVANDQSVARCVNFRHHIGPIANTIEIRVGADTAFEIVTTFLSYQYVITPTAVQTIVQIGPDHCFTFCGTEDYAAYSGRLFIYSPSAYREGQSGSFVVKPRGSLTELRRNQSSTGVISNVLRISNCHPAEHRRAIAQPVVAKSRLA